MSVELTRVYLARHGQTEWNLQRRRQGRLDSALTPRGLAQAQRNAALIAGRDIDMVFSSPLGRAVTTAEILAAEIGREVVVIDQLAELDHGRFAGLTNDQIHDRYPGALHARASDKYRWRFPGGESYADAEDRAGQALARIAGYRPHNPLVVSHEMIGRVLLRQLANLTVEDALSRSHPHDVIYRVDIATAQVVALRPDAPPIHVGLAAEG